ncbi:MAG: zinc-dependent alcohol dehydrogenase family protein [Rhizobiales bacterium]|nr:zinc-dependent alcohol dehydrogenase family protein [Hyphomicrobiales bacterium]
MRAVLYETFQTLPTVATLPDPTPSSTGVVVKVEATGLCRSDWHGWMGHDPDIRLPHVPGHELAGTISAVGRDVKTLKPGDRVTVPFVSGCGHCPECAAGHQQICDNQVQPGFTCWGSFAEYVALEFADLNVVKLPETMSFDTAAALGCRFVTSFSAVIDKGRCAPGEWVAVHGCGGVGLSAIMIAAAMGAQVIAVDLTDEKLALAKALGATAIINASGGVKVANAIRELTGGGAHLSIDALGHSATAMNSVRSLRKRGRHVQVGLMLAEHARAPLPMDRIIAYELEIKGTHGMQAHRYPDMLRMIEHGVLKPERLVARTIPLSEAPAALAAMDRFEGTGITIIRP